MTEIITDNIDLWTSALLTKSSAGRGSNGRVEAYGIKKLRELILELAVRGKLVPQDPDDEPASVLLGKIAKESKLLKKSFPDIGNDEKPFGLPQGWQWVRFGTVALHNSGKTLDRGRNTGQLRDYITTSNLYWGRFDLNNVRQMPIEDEQLEKCTARKGDLLICEGGEAGRAAVWPYKHEVCFQNHVHRARFYGGIDPYYVYRYFEKLNATGEIDQHRKGVGISNMSSKALALIVLPLPPLAEQHRIVAKVDELMALCDQLEQQQTSNSEAHQTLVETLLGTLTNPPVRAESFDSVRPELVEGTNGAQDRLVEGRVASQPFTLRQAQGERGEGDGSGRTEYTEAWTRIANHFDTLFTTEQSIDQLKQTILQLAVMGKLVPQDPNDEPASALLKRMFSEREDWLKKNEAENKECSTMLRKLKTLKTPKAPFELPATWGCVHLIQASRLLVDCHNKTAPYAKQGIPIIRTSNIRERNFRMDDVKFVSTETYDYWSRRCPPAAGDVIFTREAPMGEAAIIPEGAKFCLGQRTMLIRPMHDYISVDFLLLALTEPHLLERASEHAIGSTVKHLRVGDVENLNIPIPPLAEQHRIVAKVNELMTLCDVLKARLAAAQITQIHLADTIVEQAVA